MSALGLRVAMWNVDSKDWTINGTGQLYPWTAQNATDVLASVFKYGYYVNYWGGGGDISTPALWTNLTWLPGGPNYQGFISLEHELTDGDHALSVQYLNTIFNTPFTHFNPGTNPNGGKFVPALFYECDQALGAAATPYLSTADPFYNLVTYWYSKLPITQAVMSATDGVYQFGQPVANTTDPLSTGGSGNGGGGVTAGGASGTPGASVTATSTKKSSGPAMVEVSRGGVLAVVVTVVAVLAAGFQGLLLL
ncbi:hypothetical protein HK101_008701 [Irineochytrium annulatum]|nr:hypothetical protein HK101_008701 [Irineochytrium annulatum]